MRNFRSSFLLQWIAFLFFNVGLFMHNMSFSASVTDGCLLSFTDPLKFIEIVNPLKTNLTDAIDNNKVLVVYTGPDSKNSPKAELYEKNFEYFLKNGIDCRRQDTLAVVGHEYYEEYKEQALRISDECALFGNKFILLARRSVCYDMESVRLAMFGGAGISIEAYDYMVYVNCGVTGPGRPEDTDTHWTERFISRLDDKVKMTGLTVNCLPRPHIQSMMFALDRKGIDIIKKSGAVFDCVEHPVKSFVSSYEIKMSDAILGKGFALRPTLGKDYIFTNDTKLKDCTNRDIWMVSRLKDEFGGKIPDLAEVVFFKTSRVMPDAIAREINFTGTIANWP